MGAPQIQGFLRIEGRVNATENNIGALLPRHFADFISAQRIPGMNSNSHDIAGLEAARISRNKCFIHENRVVVSGRCGRRQHIKPAWRDDRRAKGRMAWVDQVNRHEFPSPGQFVLFAKRSNHQQTFSTAWE